MSSAVPSQASKSSEGLVLVWGRYCKAAALGFELVATCARDRLTLKTQPWTETVWSIYLKINVF